MQEKCEKINGENVCLKKIELSKGEKLKLQTYRDRTLMDITPLTGEEQEDFQTLRNIEEGRALKLPEISWKGRNFTFDYKLQQLREHNGSLRFINLNRQENELLAFAIEKGDFKLVDANMQDLNYKL